MNIPALIKIAGLSEGERAWLEGQLEARQQFNKELNDSAGYLGTAGKVVGVGGGLAGAGMTAKGLKQMISKGKSTPTGFKRTPIFVKDSPNIRLPGEPAELLAQKQIGFSGYSVGNGSAPAFVTKPGTGSTSYWRTWEKQPTGGSIVPRGKVPPRVAGKRIAIKGGLLGLGSLGLGAWLDHKAEQHRAQAKMHSGEADALKKQLGK